MTLKTEQNKLDIVTMFEAGASVSVIAKTLEMPHQTLSDFLLRKTHKSFWENYDGEGESEDCDLLPVESIAKYKEVDIETLCGSEDWYVASLAKRLRTAQRTNSQLRRTLNNTVDIERHIPDMIESVKKATASLNTPRSVHRTAYVADTEEEAIYEVLLSDYQIGKIGQYYNSELAEKAMIKYGSELMRIINKNRYNYKSKKIVLALLGDLVEDHMKHGVQSATSTDCGLSEQMAKAIEHLWVYVVQPLSALGINMEVMCIAGNHGSSQHKGMDVFKAGLYSYDYTMYKSLEGYCKVSGYDHVKFLIPEGMFGYTDIFGRYVVYSHGYTHGCTEKNLEDERARRSNQLKRYVEYYRCGDMHHVCNYDNGKLVVNGAFFGADTEGQEYSGVLGFSSIPAQVMMLHVDDKSIGRNTVKETYVIQVADGY